MKRIVFGPIISRRFGVSLGVDLSPKLKQCNFDCLYCELGGAKTRGEMNEIIPLNQVLDEIRSGLERYPQIDVLSITASGEPTLYPFLLELSYEIKALTRGKCKTLILSNGSRFGNPQIAQALHNFDIVKFSLDCVSERCFKRLDRPFCELKINEILWGIEDFAKSFSGELVCEVLVLKKLNDSRDEMQKIAQFLRKIGVARVDLGSIDRPPAYRVEGVGNEILEVLSEAFEGLCVSIPKRREVTVQRRDLKDAQELLEILARRPIAQDEFCSLFEERSLELLESLLEKGAICIKNVANMKFFALNP